MHCARPQRSLISEWIERIEVSVRNDEASFYIHQRVYHSADWCASAARHVHPSTFLQTLPVQIPGSKPRRLLLWLALATTNFIRRAKWRSQGRIRKSTGVGIAIESSLEHVSNHRTATTCQKTLQSRRTTFGNRNYEKALSSRGGDVDLPCVFGRIFSSGPLKVRQDISCLPAGQHHADSGKL